MLAVCRHFRWGIGPQVLAFLLVGSLARADGLQASSVDGLYVTAGPLAGGARVEGEWTAGVGLELSLVAVREKQIPAAWGLCGGWFSYSERPGGRLWLEAEVALSKPLPFGIGFGLGPALEVDKVRPPRLGAQGTLWLFAGVVPYVRAGVLQERGVFMELGLMIKLPLPRIAAW